MTTTNIVAAANALCDPENKAYCDTGLPVVAANGSALATGLTILFGIIGALSVLMVVIGGFRLIESQGDPQGTKKGRNTIIGAMLGLVIALSAEIIVTFTLGRL